MPTYAVKESGGIKTPRDLKGRPKPRLAAVADKLTTRDTVVSTSVASE